MLDRMVALTSKEGDTKEDRELKMQFVPLALMCFILSLAALVSVLVSPPHSITMTIGCYIITAAFALGLLHCVVLKQPPMVEVVTFLAIFGILATDLGQTVTVDAMRTWSLVVVMMDWRLLMGASHLGSAVLIGVVLAYLFVTLLNRVVPFGLTSQYISKEDSMVYMCDDPPCDKSVGLAAREYVVYVTVFVVDYLATRFFSESLRRERRRMEAAIETAGKVAQALADFDLEGADAANQSDVLPKGLVDAFDAIVCNLRVYKPYLPDSCLPSIVNNNDTTSTHQSQTTRDITVLSMNSTTASTCLSERPHEYRKAHITLSIFNIRNFLDLPWEEMQGSLGQLVGLVGRRVRDNLGLVEGLSGDRIYAVYNGVKRCPKHAAAAARSALLVKRDWSDSRVSLSIGVASGTALCGEMGDSQIRRYVAIGKVGFIVHYVERWAAQRAIPVLCNGATYQDVSNNVEARLLVNRLLITKGTTTVECTLWSLLRERNIPEADEWLYELQGSDRWGGYNSVVQALHCEGLQKALEMADQVKTEEVDRLVATLKGMLWNGITYNYNITVTDVGLSVEDAVFPEPETTE